MLADGFTTRRGRHGALIYSRCGKPSAPRPPQRPPHRAHLRRHDSDNADYQVILEPQATFVGTVNEDFAVESLQGDIFQLGNISYRILRVEQGRVRVEDAQGQPPTIPFWLGEAPGRSDELSNAVSRLREEIENRLGAPSATPTSAARTDPDAVNSALKFLTPAFATPSSPPSAGSSTTSAFRRRRPCNSSAISPPAAQRSARCPLRDTIIFERFFDETGGMQLVIHSPFGSRINRAWGLALRKRFCRSFNFELQAAATEDTIILSLTTVHSFELAEVARYLHSNTVRPLLVQALCAAPMFPARWRWSATIALALPRFRGGKKVPPQLARMASEDLLTAVFPTRSPVPRTCRAELEIPDHPLVRQTIHDCLEEAMDIEGFEQLLRGLESGAIRVIARDLTEPSPLALEVLNARPYAYLDDAPLEERRTQAVMARRWLDPESAADIGKLDPEAIQRVRDEAWPDATNSDELHDACHG